MLSARILAQKLCLQLATAPVYRKNPGIRFVPATNKCLSCFGSLHQDNCASFELGVLLAAEHAALNTAKSPRICFHGQGEIVSQLKSVLVVGGGIAGMSCAIQMRKAGIAVDIVDLDPDWRVFGAGITITGPTLRAFKRVGVIDEVVAQGANWDRATVFAANGEVLEEISFLPVEEGVPAVGGIMRPALHKILSARTLALDAKVRLGITVTEIDDEAERVSVVFSDGTTGSYDLVVGADGAFSKMRDRLFPDAPRPKFTGQGIYRLVAEKPAEIKGSYFYMGTNMKVGFNPVSPTHMYMFLLEYSPTNPWIPPEEQAPRLYDLMAGFGGIVPGIRATVMNSTSINYRPLEAVILPAPWYKGRVVLIGDAAHATTPHLASGAGMAVEDGVVLTEEIQSKATLEQALQAFMHRRFDRCRLVVENSVRLGELEMIGAPPHEHTKLMMDSVMALRQPL